jgi:hypothetical protein
MPLLLPVVVVLARVPRTNVTDDGGVLLRVLMEQSVAAQSDSCPTPLSSAGLQPLLSLGPRRLPARVPAGATVATGVEICLLLRVLLSPSCATQATVTSPTTVKVMSNNAHVGHSLSDICKKYTHVNHTRVCAVDVTVP